MSRFSTQCFSFVLASCCTVSGCSFFPTQTAPLIEDATNGADETPTSDSEAIAEAEPESDTDQAASSPQTPASPQRDFFTEGVDRAQSAVSIGQSAQSPDDWRLAESRWNQAISLMQQVPETDPNHASAQQKTEEYQQSASQAAQKAAGEVSTSGGATVVDSNPDGLVAQIPIVRRTGGIPVVPVTLTGNEGTQQFTMLFDTGASGTLITAAMARNVGVVIVGEATVIVADGRQVQLPVGYVDTLEVGGLVVRDILVGIGGDVGLLGQDVYGQYGISAGGSSINLYE